MLALFLNIAAAQTTQQTEYQILKLPDGGLVRAKLVNVSWIEDNTVLGAWSKVWRSSTDPDQLVVYEWQGPYAKVDWSSLNPQSQYTGREYKLVEALAPDAAAKYNIADIPVWHSEQAYYPSTKINIPLIGDVQTEQAKVKQITETMPQNATAPEEIMPIIPIIKDKEPVTAEPAAPVPAAPGINIMAIVISAVFTALIGLVVYLLTKKDLVITLVACAVMAFMVALPYLV
jgi:hypothetical protein